MKKIAITMLALWSLSFAHALQSDKVNAQREANAALAQHSIADAAPHSEFSSAACAFTFISGADNTFLKFCVTVNGNVTVLQSPVGQEHIAAGEIGEGYGICEVSDMNAVEYYDYAEYGDSGNWGPPSVLSQTSTSVTIARTTSNGTWTLTQTFTQVSGDTPAAKIAMTLKNNSQQNRAVLLFRYADVDADSVFENNLDATVTGAFGWNSTGFDNPFGLVLQNAGALSGVALFRGLVQDVPDGPKPCTLFEHEATGPVSGIDGSLVLVYGIRVPKGKSKTISVSYQGF